MRKNKKYTKEFKEEAVKLVMEQNYTKEEAARSLGICASNIKRWCQEISNGTYLQEKNCVQNRDEELLSLKKQIKRLEMERDILKKAAAFFASESL